MSGVGADLVDALFWRQCGLGYRAFVRILNGKYYFEGRVRHPDGTHEYFPCEDWYAEDIGECDIAKPVVAYHLRLNGCPAEDIDRALSEMDKCK